MSTHLKKTSKRVNMQDVANLAGVSKATVSLALKNDSRVSRETVSLVEAAARRLHYKTNVLVSGIFSGKSYNLGVMMPGVHDAFASRILQGIEISAQEHNYDILLLCSGTEALRERECLHRLLEKRVDGIIILPIGEQVDVSHFEELQRYDVPFVIIDKNYPGITTNYVISDDHRGAMMVVEHLAGLGHRRIAHLAGPPVSTTAKLRLEGFIAGMMEHNLPLEKQYIIETSYQNQEAMGYDAAMRLMSLPVPPTAIFTVSDTCALGVCRALYKLGLRVGEDISVVGFANLYYAEHLPVSLTTVKQHKFEMGRRAVELLVSTLADPELKPQTAVLANELIIRESTGPCRPD